MRKSFAATAFAALMLALCTGAAFAGNGHGGGNGGGHDSAQSQPPAQQAPASEPAAQPATTDNSTGVKPSSTTKHDTHARADSNQTKSYGNGQTAGKIATSRGASGDTVLHGPGNSQPHKVVACGHSHEVDVHAIKSYDSASCGAQKHEVAAATHEVKQQAHVVKQQAHVVVVAHEAKKHEQQVVVVAHANEQHEQSTEEQKSTVVASTQTENKVYICHATGSATNPYVLIHVSKNAEWAHTHHQDGRDIVLGESAAAGCPTAPPAAAVASAQTTRTQTVQAQATTQTCTTQQTVQVVEGVKHFVGPKGSGRYVIIHPSMNSAHFALKHPDEIVYGTKTVSVQVACPTAPQAPAAAAAAQAQEQQSATTTTTAAASEAVTVVPPPATTTASANGVAGTSAQSSSAPAGTTAPTGGVLGAQATIAPKKPSSGGVLGATGRIASSRLPFTGIELWIVALVAAALIGAGLTLRRASRGTI